MSKMRRLLLTLFAVVLTAAPQHVDFPILKEEVLREHLQLAHPKNAERFKRLKELFAKSGCGDASVHEQKVSGSKEPNIICGIDAPSGHPKTIIVGAHFDAVGGDGVIDNWSGAVLLPALFEFTAKAQRRHAFEFIGFAAEEKGLLGSNTYVHSIPKAERGEIAAVIILDSLGLTPTKCWVHGSTKDLVIAANRVAASMKLDFQEVDVEKVGTTDSQPFLQAHIPVLCLHSVTPETWKVINGSRDVWSAVSWKDYYDSHKLVSALLRYFDETLP